MSYQNPSLESRRDCEYFGHPTGPEPPNCWSCDKPVGEVFIQSPDGPECGDCLEEGRLALIRELGMTPEEFIEEGKVLGSQHDGSCLPGVIDRDTVTRAAQRIPGHRQTAQSGDAGSIPADLHQFPPKSNVPGRAPIRICPGHVGGLRSKA